MKFRLPNLALSILVLAMSSMAWGTVSHSQTVAYTNATIETLGPAGTIEAGTIVVRGDTIVDVGQEIDVPDDAKIVSLAGMTVMPGMIDPYFVFSSSAGASSTRTVTFNGRTFTIPGSTTFSAGSFSKVGEYFYPYKFDFKPAVRTGITVGNFVSNGRGLSALSNLAVVGDPEMLFESEGFMFAKITNQTSSLDVIRKPLAPKKTSSSTSSSSKSRSASTSTDPTKAFWESVRQGKKPLFVNVNNAAALAYLLQFMKDQDDVKLVVVSTGSNLYQSLDKLADNKNITVVLQPGIDRVPYTSDLMNVSQMLAEREIPFAFSMSLSNSQMKASQDDPMFPLAMLVRTGLNRTAALQAVTTKPAELLGLEKTHGSIEKNKHANLLVFDGDPLQTGSQLRQVILNGKTIHEN